MSQTLSRPRVDSLHDRDLALWAEQQARLLEERRCAEIDLEHLIDEVKPSGRFEKREIRHRLEVLVAQLLKWRYQPGHRTPSWLPRHPDLDDRS